MTDSAINGLLHTIETEHNPSAEFELDPFNDYLLEGDIGSFINEFAEAIQQESEKEAYKLSSVFEKSQSTGENLSDASAGEITEAVRDLNTGILKSDNKTKTDHLRCQRSLNTARV